MAQEMAAAVIDRYGPPEVLHLARVPVPGIRPDQVLVRVRAASVNPADWKARNGDMKFFMSRKFPKILGLDLAGDVVSVGGSVTDFKPGDAVYSFLDVRGGGGSYAEYAAVPAAALAPKPKNLGYPEAAAIPVVALTAVQGLRDKGGVKAGAKVLIIGASGGVGSVAVQIAKILGARVTGVCSTRNVDFVRELGAERVIDYTKMDFAKEDVRYDVIFNAATSEYADVKPVLARGGTFVTIIPSPRAMLDAALSLLPTATRVRTLIAIPKAADLRQVTEWIEAGKLRPTIEKIYPLAEAAEAHKASETGRTRGKLVIIMPDGAAQP